MFVTLVTSVVIEYTQLKIGRTFDIDDITLNLVGGLFGFLIYYIIRITDDHLPDVLRTDLIKNIVTIRLSPARNARHCELWKVRGAPPQAFTGFVSNLSGKQAPRPGFETNSGEAE